MRLKNGITAAFGTHSLLTVYASNESRLDIVSGHRKTGEGTTNY